MENVTIYTVSVLEGSQISKQFAYTDAAMANDKTQKLIEEHHGKKLGDIDEVNEFFSSDEYTSKGHGAIVILAQTVIESSAPASMENKFVLRFGKELLESANAFINYNSERDKLNKMEEYDQAFEVECSQRVIGGNLSLSIKTATHSEQQRAATEYIAAHIDEFEGVAEPMFHTLEESHGIHVKLEAKSNSADIIQKGDTVTVVVFGIFDDTENGGPENATNNDDIFEFDICLGDFEVRNLDEAIEHTA